MEISKDVIKNVDKNLFLVTGYIHDVSSKYYDPKAFENLALGITKFCDETTPLIITGDFNGRTGVVDDKYLESHLTDFEIRLANSIDLPLRKNCDSTVNQQGRSILELCHNFNLNILNGRSSGDPLGNFTYNNVNLGASTIDYSICSQNIYDKINNFMVLPQNELSDHSKIVTELKVMVKPETLIQDNYDWETLPNNFIWDDTLKSSFSTSLGNNLEILSDIKQRIEAGLIRSTGEKIQNLFIQTANKVLKQNHVKIKKTNNTAQNKKKWFDKECNNLKREVRKLGRHKGKDPRNNLLREKYHEKLGQYKRTCNSKKFKFWQDNFIILEKACKDPKEFWNKWRECTEHFETKLRTKITGETWFNYFSNLHTADIGDKMPGASINPKQPCVKLNRPFTITELTEEIKKIKTNKSVGYDRISNEMIKNSPMMVKRILLDFLNLCLEQSIAPESFCNEIITPIYKNGSADDPNNYRGICVSSALTKLFTSLISSRFQKEADEKGLISKNQIGFRKNYRTADHLLTLKAVVKKYVTKGENKLFTCFVDLKKAYDSIPHQNLFIHLRNLGLNGKLIDLVENIYKQTNCAVKVNGKITNFFNYTKGVRQGCPLSCLLFNLYVNDIIHAVNQASDSHVQLYENDIINVLMYADDLIIIAKSKEELQKKMDVLTSILYEKKLEINESKTKCMIFNRGNRLCKNNLTINGITIENVKTFKYLGFTIGAKNCSFTGTITDLSIKTKRAIFALNNKIQLSKMPVKLSLKIFTTQLAPILLYGAEIWGPYVFNNLNNWEKNETEKVHTQFLKRILGCDIHTSNIMTRTEIGRRPLICDIIKKSALYIKHVKSNMDSLAGQALAYENENYDDDNIFHLVRKFTPFHQGNHEAVQLLTKKGVKKQNDSFYKQVWKTEIAKLSKAESYLQYKNDIRIEEYLTKVKNIKHRKAITRLRLSCHPLMIEKGRHQKIPLQRSERTCQFCDSVIEDECHFITTCPKYDTERIILYMAATENSKHFENMPNETKFIFLFSNEDTNVMSQLGAYIFNCLKKRENEMIA